VREGWGRKDERHKDQTENGTMYHGGAVEIGLPGTGTRGRRVMNESTELSPNVKS
jgi:hypothetical protein